MQLTNRLKKVVRLPWSNGPEWRASLAAQGLPLLTGGLLALSFLPAGGPWTPFVTFLPLAFHLSGAQTPLGFNAGLLVAAPAYAVGLSWVVPSLSWRSGLAWPVFLLLVASLALVAGGAVLGAVEWNRRGRTPLPITLAVAWTGLEWGLSVFPAMPFAWLGAGAALAWSPPLASLSELTGASGLTFWTVAVGAGLGVWLRRLLEPGAYPSGVLGRQVALVALMVAPLAFGILRVGSFPLAEPDISVLAVQTGRNPADATDVPPGEWLRHLVELTSRGMDEAGPLEDGDRIDLVVFPEMTTVLDSAAVRQFAQLSRRVGAPILIGAPDQDGGGGWYNAAYLLGEDGVLANPVRKRRLVPGVEAATPLPLRALGLLDHGYRRGGAQPLLKVKNLALSVLVCYDSAFPGLPRQDFAQGAGVVLVLSNDDWIDPQAPFRTTIAYWQHATQGLLRAVELRTGLVQVAATGLTFSVDPLGRMAAPPLPATAVRAVVLPMWSKTTRTIFSLLGDILGPLCCMVLVLVVGAWLLRERTGSRLAG